MSKAPRIAIVGVGSIGSKHINNLLAMGYQDLVGIDHRPMPNEERFPIISAFCDLEPLRPTHALICSPPDWHYHHAKYFVDRGIPTFIEKPMTVSKLEASELCVTAHMNKSVLAVGYMERAHPVVKKAKEFIEEYGCARAEIYCYWKATEKTYPLYTAQESSHAIDLAQFLLGNMSLMSVKDLPWREVVLTVKHARACETKICMNAHENWPRRVISLESEDHRIFSEIYGTTTEEWTPCYQEELTAFLDGNPLCTGEDGLRVVEILEEIG